MRSAVSGSCCCKVRNSVPKRTNSRDGEVVVTVAVRRPSPRIAASPKKSPGPSFDTSRPSIRRRRGPLAKDEERVSGGAFACQADSLARVLNRERWCKRAQGVAAERCEQRDSRKIVWCWAHGLEKLQAALGRIRTDTESSQNRYRIDAFPVVGAPPGGRLVPRLRPNKPAPHPAPLPQPALLPPGPSAPLARPLRARPWPTVSLSAPAGLRLRRSPTARGLPRRVWVLSRSRASAAARPACV